MYNKQYLCNYFINDKPEVFNNFNNLMKPYKHIDNIIKPSYVLFTKNVCINNDIIYNENMIYHCNTIYDINGLKNIINSLCVGIENINPKFYYFSKMNEIEFFIKNKFKNNISAVDLYKPKKIVYE
jgi:hypothetical protein